MNETQMDAVILFLLSAGEELKTAREIMHYLKGEDLLRGLTESGLKRALSRNIGTSGTGTFHSQRQGMQTVYGLMPNKRRELEEFPF